MKCELVTRPVPVEDQTKFARQSSNDRQNLAVRCSKEYRMHEEGSRSDCDSWKVRYEGVSNEGRASSLRLKLYERTKEI